MMMMMMGAVSLKKLRIAMVSFATCVALMVVGAPLASSATNTWLNTQVNPDGTVYSDTRVSSSKYFTRTGINAWIDKSNGHMWETKVWFGGYSTSGQTSATLDGPRSYLVTKASYLFKGTYSPNNRSKVVAKMLGAKMTGTGMGAPLLPSGSTDTMTTSSETPAEDVLMIDALRAGALAGVEVNELGASGGAEYWSGFKSDGRQQCLYISHGEYVGSTCVPENEFADSGLTQTMTGPDFSAQVVLVSESRDLVRSSESAQFTEVSDGLFVNNGEQVEGQLASFDKVSQRVTGHLPLHADSE